MNNEIYLGESILNFCIFYLTGLMVMVAIIGTANTILLQLH